MTKKELKSIKNICGFIMSIDSETGKKIRCIREFRNKYNLIKHIK